MAETKRQRIEQLIERGDRLAKAQDTRQHAVESRDNRERDAQVCSSRRSKWTTQEDDKLRSLVTELGRDWSAIATHFPSRDRKRCRERFLNRLEPSLTATAVWSKEEDEKLLQLQAEFKCQWTKIAKHLTGKSAESVKNRCLALARRAAAANGGAQGRRAPSQNWTKEEQEKLRSLVDTNGARNWLFIASQLPGRTDLQCLQQWYRTLDGMVIKGRGTWTESEDRVLVEKVGEIGRKWAKVAAFLPGRIGTQCRERFLNHLDPAISKTPWTQAEDTILFEAHKKHSTQWGVIAKDLPGRSENAIKNHWYKRQRRQILGVSPPLPAPL